MTQVKNNRGLTLIEIMLSILVLAVMVIGTSGYRYYSTLDVRKAVKHSSAAKIALKFLESWRGRQGSIDAATLAELTDGLASVGTTGRVLPTGYTQFGTNCYRLQSDGVNYYITLSYNDALKPGLRILNVKVVWPTTMNETSYWPNNYQVFTLEKYVCN